MKRCSIDDIKGGEILAHPIMTPDYQVILSEGTVLQKQYIQNFRDLGITEIYINDEQKEEIKNEKEQKRAEINAARMEIGQECKLQVKNLLEKHIYHENIELEKLSGMASTIIDDILKEENVIGEMIEIKGRSTDLYEHSLSCCILSIILGLRMDFSYDMVHAIGVGCLLHDMGLRFISVNFNNIDMEDMPKNQRTEYKKHTVYGYSSVENEKWLSKISKNIILYHHERMDGTGYPFHSRKIKKEISLASICDEFDEMICGIGCRRTEVYKAIEYLKSFKNVKFDGKIVDEFLKYIAVYPVGSCVLTNAGKIGIVIRQNKGFPERPVIRIVSGGTDGSAREEIILDLLKEKSVFIEDVIN